ncbi:MAG: glycosyltransferase family 39 protein [Gemmatimonadetes bacterium]|nr:glycosyltransferase family 39 protein [Gemmatimonadota bacterium]
MAFLLRLLFRLEVHGDPLFGILAIDSRSYVELARRFAAGDWFFGSEPLWFAPLYPVLLGAFFRIFGEHLSAVVWIQHGLGVGSAVLAAGLGLRFGRLAGWVAGLLVAVTPVAIAYESQLLYTSLATFLTAVALTAWLRADDRETDRPSALAGLALGALALLRTNVVLFAPVAALFLFRRRPGGWRRPAAFVGGLALVLAGVLLRNGLAAGVWTPLTVNGGMILATGFAEDARGGRALERTPNDFGPGGAYQREAERATGRAMTLAEASDWHRARTMERITADPGAAVRGLGRKLLLFANAAEIDDNLGYEMLRPRSGLLRLWPKPWLVFFVLGFLGAGFAVAARAGAERAGGRRAALGLAAFTIVWMLSLLPFFVTARYRLPLIVPLAALAGYAVGEIRDRWRARRFRGLAGAGVAVVALAFLGARDPGVRADPGMTWNAIGAALHESGRSDEALDVLDRATRARPDLAGPWVNRALALGSLGRLPEAIESARRATEAEPDVAAGWRALGAFLAQSGDYAAARVAFERDVSLAPQDPVAWTNVARIRAATGDLPGAVEAGESAIRFGAAQLAGEVAQWKAEAARRP